MALLLESGQSRPPRRGTATLSFSAGLERSHARDVIDPLGLERGDGGGRDHAAIGDDIDVTDTEALVQTVVTSAVLPGQRKEAIGRTGKLFQSADQVTRGESLR